MLEGGQFLKRSLENLTGLNWSGSLSHHALMFGMSNYMVMLPNPFLGMGELRGDQQSGHTSRSGQEVKNGSSAKDGAPERLRWDSRGAIV